MTLYSVGIWAYRSHWITWVIGILRLLLLTSGGEDRPTEHAADLLETGCQPDTPARDRVATVPGWAVGGARHGPSLRDNALSAQPAHPV